MEGQLQTTRGRGAHIPAGSRIVWWCRWWWGEKCGGGPRAVRGEAGGEGA